MHDALASVDYTNIAVVNTTNCTSWCRLISIIVLLPTNLTSDNVSEIMKDQVGCSTEEDDEAGAQAAAAAVRPTQPARSFTFTLESAQLNCVLSKDELAYCQIEPMSGSTLNLAARFGC